MLSALRARLWVALSLTCAVAPVSACKKSDDATDVEEEGIKKKKPKPKPEPPVKKKRDWVPEGGIGKGHCSSSYFCSTAPEISNTADSDALRAQCGSSAKIPESVAVKGFEGRNAWMHEAKTKEEREKEHEPEACCYSYQTAPCGKGRPLRHEGALVLAGEVRRDDWCQQLSIDLAGHQVDALVEHLRRVALLEHASVAAFSRVSLELLALGAPPELIEGAHRAALDEIRHAQLCWSVLAAISRTPHGPSPMSIPSMGPVDPAEVLISTVMDGCVGETLGSLMFAEAARGCAVPELALVYATIADEEAEHAALAFRIVRFLVARDPSLSSLVAAAAARAPRVPGEGPADAALGLLDRATQQRVLDRGYAEVVLPLLVELAGTNETSSISPLAS
jgi:hypothetical protein